MNRGGLLALAGLVVAAALAWWVFSAVTDEDPAALGEVDFAVSCAPAVQDDFERATALLHHMMYAQAAVRFSDIVEADPDCAMAYWGVAKTQLRPLWAPPTDDEFTRGSEAVAQARALAAPSEREQAWIEAIGTYYDTAAGATHAEGVQAWESAMGDLHANWPEDIDAGAFYALAQVATAPSDDHTYSHQRRAGALLEELLEKAPEHPGLFHYLIHAYDNPELAEQAVDVARAYDQLAPDVPHALHMPSHIFVRLGIWPDTIEWNRRSAEAALRQSPDAYVSMHHVHALDYEIYGYLQQGRDDRAREVLEEIRGVENYQPHPATAYGIAAAQARYALERRDWAQAASLPPRIHEAFPWDDYPAFEAITYWARGLGAARTGDLDAAREAVERLDAFHQRTLEQAEDYWALHVDVQRKTVEAWIAHAEGNRERARQLMMVAAELEDSVDKSPITPSAVLPARELYGDMLLDYGMHELALEAYEQALRISPNRFHSLYGAGLAASHTGGRPQVAREYLKQLIRIAEGNAEHRPQLQQAMTLVDS